MAADPQITRKAALEVARRGAVRLALLVQKSGKFIYRYDRRKKPRPAPDYNALRHCGAVWSMLDTVGTELPAVTAAADRAIDFLLAEMVHPVPQVDGARGVVDNRSFKIGGNGLALLALLERHARRPDDRLISEATAFGRYIVSEQQDDGDFIHARVFETYRVRPFRSNYYTGEAMFGLVRLFEATGDATFLDAVVRAEETLGPRDYGVPEHSHWMLYALDALHVHRPEPALLEHAARIARRIVDEPGYRDRRQGTPVACRSEGLTAYLRLHTRAGGDTDLAADVLSTLRENLLLQLTWRTPKGDFHGGDEDNEIRIDHIQHNISSYLGYSRLPDDLLAG